jgi:hypothetical protein
MGLSDYYATCPTLFFAPFRSRLTDSIVHLHLNRKLYYSYIHSVNIAFTAAPAELPMSSVYTPGLYRLPPLYK